MSGVGGVSGGDQPKQFSPEELEKYQADYKKGFDLFQKSFKDYTKPNVEFHKKKQLEKVMDEALQVMNETASVSLKKGKIKDEEQLTADYAAFKEHPTPENQQKIVQDIQNLSE